MAITKTDQCVVVPMIIILMLTMMIIMDATHKNGQCINVFWQSLKRDKIDSCESNITRVNPFPFIGFNFAWRPADQH